MAKTDRKVVIIILDVGCGNKPTGDVNVDLYIKSGKHRGSRQWAYRKPLFSPEIPNLICADIHALPFPDGIFQEVHCFDVLEHKGINFYEAINELLRVAKVFIEIAVPSIWDYGSHPRKNKAHQTLFTNRQLNHLLRHYPHSTKHEKLGRLAPVIPIYVPTSFKVRIWKKVKNDGA